MPFRRRGENCAPAAQGPSAVRCRGANGRGPRGRGGRPRGVPGAGRPWTRVPHPLARLCSGPTRAAGFWEHPAASACTCPRVQPHGGGRRPSAFVGQHPQAPARLLEERRVSGPGPKGGLSPVPGAQRSRPRRVGLARSPAQSGRCVTPPALGLCERWSPTHRPLQQPLLPERAAQLDLGDAFSGFPWSARGRLRRGPRQPCRSPTPSCTLSPTHGPHHPPRVLSGRKQLWSKDRVTEAALCSG